MKFSCAFLLLSGLVVPASGQTGYVNGQAARGELGQPTFLGGYGNTATYGTTGTAQNIFSTVQGVAATPNLLFVADSSILVPQGPGNNNRVLMFNPNLFPTPTADLTGIQNNTCPLCFFPALNVLGQPNYTTANQATTVAANTLNIPTAVATDGTHLVIADTNNNRILIYNEIPTAIQQPADLVLGQTNFTTVALDNVVSATTMSGPQGVWIQNGKLFVADTQNSRVLIWNEFPTSNNQPADVVLGEPNFSTRYVAPATGAVAAANTLYDPASVSSDGTHLFVTDLGNHRVLIWNSIPTTNQQAADVELGQLDMTHNIANDSPDLCPATGQDASGNYTYQPLCAYTMSYPRFALSDGTRLYVADGGNDRVLIWATVPTASHTAADNVLGQPDMISDVVSDQPELITSTTVSNASSTDTMRTPSSLAWDGTNLWVADPYDARVLWFTPGSPNFLLPNDSVLNAASLQIHAEGYVAMALISGDTITAGQTVTVTIGGNSYTYTIVASDTLNSIVNGLVKAINNSNSGAGDPNATARNAGNNQLALQAKAEGAAGNNVSLATSLSTNASITATPSGNNLTGGTGATLAPGTVVVINAPSGISFSPDGQNHIDDTVPLDVTYEGIQVYVDGVACPIAYVNPDQIRVQIPFQLYNAAISQATNSASLYVRKINADGSISVSNAIPLIIVDANPGIFSLNDGTPPTVMAFHASDHATAVVSVDGSITAGNTATITVGGNSYTYTVLATDTLTTVETALVNMLNVDPNVTASASGQFNRITLTARVPGLAGMNIPVSSSVSSGAAIIITVFNSTTCCVNTAGAPVTTANPAVPNELINIFATGLGLVADTSGNLITTFAGRPYTGPQPNSAFNTVSATMNGTTAEVLSAGFQPGAIGLAQVTLQIPSTITSATESQLYIAQNAYISNTVNIPVSASAPALINVGQVVVSPGATIGSTTVYAQATNPAKVVVGSATGTVFCTVTGYGSCQTGNWVTDGMTFFLVDAGTGAVLSEAVAHLTNPQAILTANPNPILNDGTGLGTTTITVNANVPVNIYIGSTLFCGPVTTGACVTGKWVTNGMTFTAIQQGTKNVLGTLSVVVRNPTAVISIPPVGNDGSGLGIATVSFVADEPADLHVGPTPFCNFGGASFGTCTTGKWVTPDTVFYVVSHATGVVIAAATATFAPPAGSITLFPNPIVTLDGTGVVYANITTTSNIIANVNIGSTLLCTVNAGQGSCSTGKYVTNGTVISLVNPYNNQVLSSTKVQVVPAYGTLTIPGNPYTPDSNGLATVTLNYTSVANAAIYVGPTLLCYAPAGSGSCQTGEWVHDGMAFSLVDTTTNATLATATAYVRAEGSLTLSPNPIPGSNGVGSTVVNYWANVPVDVYAGSALFCSVPSGSGSCATGAWVSNGFVFTLVDHLTGATLASTTAQVVSSGN